MPAADLATVAWSVRERELGVEPRPLVGPCVVIEQEPGRDAVTDVLLLRLRITLAEQQQLPVGLHPLHHRVALRVTRGGRQRCVPRLRASAGGRDREFARGCDEERDIAGAGTGPALRDVGLPQETDRAAPEDVAGQRDRVQRRAELRSASARRRASSIASTDSPSSASRSRTRGFSACTTAMTSPPGSPYRLPETLPHMRWKIKKQGWSWWPLSTRTGRRHAS